MNTKEIIDEINETIRNGKLTREHWEDKGMEFSFDMPDGTKKGMSLYARNEGFDVQHVLLFETKIGEHDKTIREIRFNSDDDFWDISNAIGDALVGVKQETEPKMEMNVRFVWEGTTLHAYVKYNGNATEVTMDYIRELMSLDGATVEFIETFLSDAFNGWVMG